MAGPGMAVGDEDVAEAAAGERRTVIDQRVAHDALADGHRADRLEGEGAQMQRGRQHHRPAGAGAHQPLGDRLGKVARGEGVHADRQVRPVLFQGTHGEHDDRARAVERIERDGRHLLEPMDGQKLLPFVAVR